MSAARVISLIGLPGAGKTTLGRALAAQRGAAAKYVGVGEALRERAATDTALRDQLAAGLLGPEEMVLQLVREEYAACPADFLILDGFPRHVAQVSFAREQFARWGVLYLDLDRETAVRRLATRRVCGHCGAAALADDAGCGVCGSKRWVARSEDAGAALPRRLYDSDRDLRKMVAETGRTNPIVRLDARMHQRDLVTLAVAALVLVTRRQA